VGELPAEVGTGQVHAEVSEHRHRALAKQRQQPVTRSPSTDRHPERKQQLVLGALPEPGRNRSAQPGVQAGRKALRIRYINGMEVRKKRPRGFKKEAQGFK
jgi:hypothetical protein